MVRKIVQAISAGQLSLGWYCNLADLLKLATRFEESEVQEISNDEAAAALGVYFVYTQFASLSTPEFLK